MKRLIPVLLGLAFVVSCTTDFELEAEWKDIPIVYAFLSIQDTAHYVRVQKAFLEPGGNALEIAEIADSLYYTDAVVELENTASGETFTLERVNAANEGYPKDDGVFVEAPHYLYKVSAATAGFEPGDEVRIVVNRSGVDPVTAETTIVGSIDTIDSSSPTINTWRDQTDVRFGWNTDPLNKIFDFRLIIHYSEFPGDNPSDVQEKTLEYIIDKSIINEDDADRFVEKVSGLQFFNYLGQNIPEKEGYIRFFNSMDMVVTGSGPELYEYIRVAQANTGITSAQSIPVYTNVDGGLGIFTSRYQLHRPGMRLLAEARDSLLNGRFTKHLNFK